MRPRDDDRRSVAGTLAPGVHASASIPSAAISPLFRTLRCLECSSPLELVQASPHPSLPDLGPDGWLSCRSCGERYPLIAGTARMLDHRGRAALGDAYPAAAASLGLPTAVRRRGVSVRERTAEGFAYEWSHFGKPRSEWRKNFLDYMRPHPPESFANKRVLDVGTGSGRHSAQAAALGAQVTAIDLGGSIDVARSNLPTHALTVQADAERLPLGEQSFDFVMSIGVLHHLPDPARALARIARYAAPGGYVHVYLYWQPEQTSHRLVLRLVTAVRKMTVRMPYRLLHALCYPLAAILFASVVAPQRWLGGRRIGRRLVSGLPLKTYADYPFRVLVNDQFDRFSAPIEHRYTRGEVETMMREAGLTDVRVLPNHGWIGDGRVPDRTPERPR